MSVTYLSPRYNGYTYTLTEDLFDTFDDAVAAKMRTDTPPGTDGDYTAGGLVAARKFTVKGIIAVTTGLTGVVQTDAATFRTLLDNFKAVHAPGPPQPFWIDTDRYLNAEVESISLAGWQRGMPFIPYEVTFRASDPYWYEGSTATPYTPATKSANLAGGGAAPPTEDTSQVGPPDASGWSISHSPASTSLLGGISNPYTIAVTWRDLYGESTATSLGTITISAGDEITVTPAGNAYSLPVITVPVTSAPAGDLVTVTIFSSGGPTYTFTLSPDATGNYVVDGTQQQETVTLSGVDVTSLFAGEFPKLVAGANTVEVGVSGGAVVGTPTIEWQDRWF